MIRPPKVPTRSANNQSANESIQSSTNVPDITSYIGKILTLNHQQVIVEDILGQGGFAFVFLVRSFNQQRYALKRMYVNNQRDLHVFQREIAIVKEFSSHPNIVKYVDSYVHRLSPTNIQTRNYYTTRSTSDDNDDDAIYEILLLTEYCSNGALINRLNEQRNIGITLNEHQILRIFADICRSVSACHFRRPQPILHRDIKLENVLIDSRQNYVLCDFGSAIMLPPSTTNEHQQYQINQLTTTVIQQLEEEIQRYTTLCYRAPEMIDLYSRKPLTLKIDIWAMGCLLYKLMYNTMPFGDSVLAIQNGTFVIPDDMAQSYSRELNLLVRYLLEIDIGKRPDIWQVAYITYKLLGTECPIPNRCQSKIPNLSAVTMPLTDSESRQQRAAALSKTKLTSQNTTDESSTLGTAVNPRERPRGMIAPSTSLINFDQVSQRSSNIAAMLPTPASATRSESASKLMFDDDFSQIPSHAISLNNIPTAISSAKNDLLVSRARPSPPTTASPTPGHVLQQQQQPQQFFPPPPPHSSNTHRRSASQTTSSMQNQSSFHNASSVDSSSSDEASDEAAEQLRTNLDKLKFHNYSKIDSQLNSDDDQIFTSMSDHDRPIARKQQRNSKSPTKDKSTSHHPSTEEAKTEIPSFTKYIIESSTENLFHRITNNGFDENLTNHSSTSKSSLNKNQLNSSLLDSNNPFLCAPFHLSPSNKQLFANLNRTVVLTNPNTCDLNSIVTGKRTSAFVPYQKRTINTENHVIGTKANSGNFIDKVSHSESLASNVLDNQASLSIDVFTKAPFKATTKTKQYSTMNDTISPSNSQFIDLNVQENSDSNRTIILTDNEPQQHGYANLSLNANVVDEYF
ncbi:unnamed protein product [Rotaria magnacalcarata]|uniref:non-specific serine/threonine protein kinase n=6 Tax=Rotaria magnacalcarata TaxID=392030 RepID=A0A816LT09_9BILA|nr:unnamed protein product [Rotaria magnacalcarata]CAF1954631.1 unnamed protein product [Rotaria magnacalcarata]